MTVFRQYKMKDSGVEWVGEIPDQWEATRLGTKFLERRTKVSDKDYSPLSVTKNGVLPQLANAAKTNDGDNRRLVKKGDFVINSRSDRKGSSGIAKMDGSVSLINIVMKPDNLFPYYCNYLLRSYSFIEEFYRVGHGIVADLWTTRYDEMKLIMVALPPFQEQTIIANFLDHKTTQIDKAVELKQQQIALLKERKQILIQNAVTKGINPDVKMKDSGVPWIGEIPEHWDVKRAKYLFREVDERSLDGTEELLSVSHMTGVTPRSEKKISMFLAEDYSGSKLCNKGNLVFNIMWAWMGALGVSNGKGIVSPSYGVYRKIDHKSFNSVYLEELLKSTNYIEYYNKVSTGLHSSRLRFYSHMFLNMRVGFPMIEEQDTIVAHIESESAKIDKAISLLQQQIEKIREYKTILINNAVTGKIRVGK